MANMFKSAADKSTISGNKKDSYDIPREEAQKKPDPATDIPLAAEPVRPEPARPGRRPAGTRETRPADPQAAEQNPFAEQLLADKIPFRQAGRSYSIYMEDDIIAAVDSLAAKLHTNRSKTINTLLRSVLFRD